MNPSAPPAPPDAVPVVRRPRFRFLRSLAPSAAALAVTLLVMAVYFQPWDVNFRMPFGYEGDALQHLMYTKSFLENGWYLQNPSLGAPGEMDLREFPGADVLPGMLTKFLGLFTRSPALVNNLLFLLTFPLTSLGAFLACRGLRISHGPAILAGVLYAFLPYHLWRNTGHLYLSCYFMVPPAILVAWWVASGRLFDRADGGGNARVALAVVICAVTSTSGIYYPFFAGLILGVAGLVALGTRGDWRHGAAGLGLAVLIAAGILLCLLPTLRFLHTHPHPAVSVRAAGESELYGLKLTQLVLPPDSHPLQLFRQFKQSYNAQAPLVTENTTAALGVLGALGSLGLLGWLLFRPLVRPSAEAPVPGAPPRLREILDVFGVFTGAAVLYGTIGGFGMLFALFVSPQLRSLNRISVYIGFFALAAVAACLDRWCVRPGRPRAVRAAGWAGLGVLLAAGVYDQSPKRFFDVVSHRRIAREYREDREFFAWVQASVPPGTMIFQLPYVAFPEADPPNKAMGSDSHFRGYLHTRGLHWSYGAVKGSPADCWQQRVTALPLPQAVRAMAFAGFGGIFLERSGYNDHGAAVEKTLRWLLGAPVAERPERLFFSLAGYTRALRASMSDQQWQTAVNDVLHMIFLRFGDGFTGPEVENGRNWYWAGPEGKLTVVNGSSVSRRVRVSMSAHTGRSDPARLTMTAPNFSQTWTIGPTLQPLTATLDLPPGGCEIHFTCDGLPIDAPSDARVMVWSPVDFELDEPDSPLLPAAPDSAGQAP